MRLFLALEIPESVRSRLVQLQGDLPGKLKLVEPQNIHITLKFLGEVAEPRAADVRGALAPLETPAFGAGATGFGVFPGPGNPRVLWAGMGRGAAEAAALSREVDGRLAPLGFPREKRFVPHATLARVKFMDGAGKARLRALLEARRGSVFGEWRVGTVALKKSTLTPAGPLYSDVEVFPLASKDS
ncbi:MAG: RNA 2',3'-cyclic phosphodiesterase [Halobacteria archaeon]